MKDHLNKLKSYFRNLNTSPCGSVIFAKAIHGKRDKREEVILKWPKSEIISFSPFVPDGSIIEIRGASLSKLEWPNAKQRMSSRRRSREGLIDRVTICVREAGEMGEGNTTTDQTSYEQIRRNRLS